MDETDESINQIRGVKELPLLPATPDSTPNNFLAFNQFFVRKQDDSYDQRRLASLQELELSRTSHTRVQAYRAFVKLLTESPFSRQARMEATNAWVNELLQYDKDKRKAFEGFWPDKKMKDWVQTPLETLRTGYGQCGDIASLKYEMLLAIGIPDSEMRLVTLFQYDVKENLVAAHRVLMVNDDGVNYILNISNNLSEGKFNLSGDRLVLASEYFKNGMNVPLTATNQSGTLAYPVKVDPNGRLRMPERSYTAPNLDKKIQTFQYAMSPASWPDTDGNYAASYPYNVPHLREDAEKLMNGIKQARDLNPVGQHRTVVNKNPSVSVEVLANSSSANQPAPPPQRISPQPQNPPYGSLKTSSLAAQPSNKKASFSKKTSAGIHNQHGRNNLTL